MALHHFVTQSHPKNNGNKAAQHQVLNTSLPLLPFAVGICFFFFFLAPKGEKVYMQNRVKCIHSSENWGWTSSRSLNTKPSFSHIIYMIRCNTPHWSSATTEVVLSHRYVPAPFINRIKEKCHRATRTAWGSSTWWDFPQSNKWLFTKAVNS